MAKFAVLILAALAFQAASAGVHNRQRYQEKTSGDYENGLQDYGYPTGKFDALFGQLQTVSQDLSVYFQKTLPNDRLVIKTLIWQCRELVQYIDTIIERLQVEAQKYSGKVSVVLKDFVTELRDIRVQYQKITTYTTDVYAVDQLKNEFYTTVQRTVVQLEKLVRCIQTDYDKTKGDLYVIVKNLVSDFLYAFQNIYNHVQYYGVYGEQTPKQLILQIEEVTKGLIGYLEGVTYVDTHRSYAIGEYVVYIETIINRLEKVEGTYGNTEIDVILQKVYGKLRRVLVPFLQLVETENIENVEVVRIELIKELKYVVEVFEQFVLYTRAGDYQTFFCEILGDYLYAIHQLRIQLQSGYHGEYYGKIGQEYYGKSSYKFGGLYDKSGYLGGLYDKVGNKGLYKYGGLYDKTGYQDGLYDRTGYQGLYKYDKVGYKGLYKYGGLDDKVGYKGLHKYGGLDDKVGYKGLYKYGGLDDKFGFKGLYKYGGLDDKVGHKGLYKYGGLDDKFGYKGLYKYGGLYDKTGYQDLHKYGGLYDNIGYQGLYKYGGLYDKTGYGYFGKYQGYAKYDLKQYEIQIQTIIRDLCKCFETVSFDDITVRQTLVHVIREYAQQLEYIVERLHQIVNYNTEGEVYIFQQIAQNLRQYVLALEQFYTSEYSGTEFKSHFCLYVQKIATEFEKLLSGIEKTNGTHLTLIREVLVQYLRVTYDLYYHCQNYSEITRYGYGPYARQYYGDNYYGGKHYGGDYYGLQEQVYETPRELVNQILYVTKDLYKTFQNVKFYNQEHIQFLSVQTRKFTEVIRYIIDRLERCDNVDTIIQQVIYRLCEVELSLQKLVTYNVFTNVHQLSIEFCQYIQVVVDEIEKLVLIGQGDIQGECYYVIKDILKFFLYGLHDINYKILEITQYGGDYIQYGKGYGYGKKSGQVFGYDTYGQGYGYGKYGYGKKYGQEFDYGKYGQGYGYGKYGQWYGYGKYDQGYGYGKGYDKYSRGLLTLGQYGYNLEGKTVEQLVYQIETVVTQVVDELQTVNIKDKIIREFFFVQARQLIQVIDNIIDRFQVKYTYGNDNTIQEVIINLRKIRVQLQQIVSSGVISTIYQIKGQMVNYFQEICVELKQLALIAENDLECIKIVKDVLGQYISYLRNVHYQLKYNVYGYQGYQSEYGYQRVPYGNYLGYGQYYQDAIRAY